MTNSAQLVSGSIDGVTVQQSNLVINDRGWLLEVARDDDAWFRGFGQVYVTATTDGVVKAWYRHQEQSDVLAIVRGAIRFVAYDDRLGSPTHGSVIETVLHQNAPAAVVIPPGVWHGFRAEGGEALVLHCNSVPFRRDDPDEERKRSDDPAIPYRWPA